MNQRAEAFQMQLDQLENCRFRLSTLGPCFAYIQHLDVGKSAEDVARRLVLEDSLVLLPGTIFGPEQESYLRVAFANIDADCFPEVMRRMQKYSQRL